MADANEEKSSSRGSRAKTRRAGTEVPAEGDAPVNEVSSAPIPYDGRFVYGYNLREGLLAMEKTIGNHLLAEKAVRL